MKSPYITAIHFTLSKEDRNQLTQICARNGVGKSEVLRRFVKDYIKENKNNL
jgi:ABC-type cobalamin/Fe3+-siderophores transport system ATPase subunit